MLTWRANASTHRVFRASPGSSDLRTRRPRRNISHGYRTCEPSVTSPDPDRCTSADVRVAQHHRRCRTRPGYPEDGDAVTSVATPGLDNAPTTHARLLAWVREMAELTTPDQVVWVDGSDEEWERLTDEAGRRPAPSPACRPSPTPSGAPPTPVTSPGSRTAPTSARSTRPTPVPPTTGWTRPR